MKKIGLTVDISLYSDHSAEGIRRLAEYLQDVVEAVHQLSAMPFDGDNGGMMGSPHSEHEPGGWKAVFKVHEER